MPAMTAHVDSWDARTATAVLSLTFDGWPFGTRVVDEPTLMMVTGSLDEPATLVGRTFERELSA